MQAPILVNTPFFEIIMAKKIILLCIEYLCVPNGVKAFAVNNTADIGMSSKSISRSFSELDNIVSTNALHHKSNISEFNEDYLSQKFSLDSITNNQILLAKAVMYFVITLRGSWSGNGQKKEFQICDWWIRSI